MARPLVFCNLQTRFVFSSHQKQVFSIRNNNRRSSIDNLQFNPSKSYKRLNSIYPIKSSASVNGYSIDDNTITISNQQDDLSAEGNRRLSQNPGRLIEFIKDILPGGSWWRLSSDHVEVVLTAKPVTVVRALQRMWELISEDRWVIFTAFASLILTAVSFFLF